MRYSYCPKCGSSLRLNEKNRLVCKGCSFVFYQNPTVGVAMILIRNGKVLLGRKRGRYSGQWCVPCGHVEWGEDVYDAAKREMSEETGLRIELTTPYTVTSLYGEPYRGTEWFNPKQQSVMIWFLVKETGGELCAGDDIDEVGYFSYGELPKIAYPAHEIVIRKLLEEQLIS
ncbi:NUDIX hydrolase [Paenibacillus antri]|uniref:NUDIX hydrolase n=1 Tax=Paenibacillus antri TaxID=2582848 RepID=A0A5R9G8W1_9BACL|nr:NUDIX hydrolase [Paenibacillus antri]